MPEFFINLNPIWDFYFNWNQELRKKMFRLDALAVSVEVPLIYRVPTESYLTLRLP